MLPRLKKPRSVSGLLAGSALLAGLAACGTVVLNDSGSLTRYDHLKSSDVTATSSRLYADQDALARTRTVRIIPTVFSADVYGAAILTPAERRLAANNADRALCYELSLRYDVVTDRDADLTVRARVTRVEPTDLFGAGSTIGLSAGTAIAARVGAEFAQGVVGLLPVPRVPIGLGSLTVEAEALDGRRRHRAAMVWGGAATSATQARYSHVSDAYDLAGEFGQDFGFYLATGQDPFKAPLTLPNWNRIRVTVLGEAPLDPDCAAYGRAPGIEGIAADYIGLPPDYADKGPATPVD